MNTRTLHAAVHLPVGLLAIALSLTLTSAVAEDDAVRTASESDPKNTDAAAPADTYLLRFQLQSGQELRYLSSQTTNMQATTSKASKTDVTKAEQRRLFTVKDVDSSGTADVAMQFEHVRMQIRSNGLDPVVFDSTMKPDEVPAHFKGAAAQLKKAAAQFEIRPRGTPVSEDGIERMAKGGHASFLLPLPEQPVAVGDTWKVHMPVQVRLAEKVMREITLLRTYRLKSVENGFAKIAFFTSIESPVRSPFVKGQLVQTTPSGMFLFDIAKGRVLRKEIKVDKSVLGAMGPDTILSVTSHTVERLLTDDDEADDDPTKVTAR